MNRSPKEEFNLRLTASGEELAKIKKQIQKISFLRIAVFLITVLVVFLLTTFNLAAVGIALAIGISLFIMLIRRHNQLELQKAHLLAIIKINTQEINLFDRKTEDSPTGEDHLDADHPYAADLDLFGKRSVFQLINRTALHSGKSLLIQSLLNPMMNREVIKERQEAIDELQHKLDWRQLFQAKGIEPQFLTGELPEDPDDLPRLLQWVSETKKTYNKMSYKIWLVLTPIIGFSVVFAIIFRVIPPGIFLLFLLLPLAILGPRMSEISRIHVLLSKKNKLLRLYARLFKLVEKETFSAPCNLKAQHKITHGKADASSEIDRLSAITAALDYRLNLLMGIVLNVFLLWDILQLIRMEKWKDKNREQLTSWFSGLADFDELNSFAGFAYGNPNSVFPEISEKEFELTGQDLKHPLMPQNKCVGNPVFFIGFKQFQVITGANMAGKSTYLRTVGVNMVLAMTGAPVLARQFKFSPVQLYTGIKTTDSLQDGESYFFAELKRLKEIIDRLQHNQPLFIILDEILRGTNSADKQKGSKALITQLIGLQASGMIATHDLALGKLAEQFPNHVINKRFEVEIAGDNLSFDYTLKDGISQNLNATFLMEKMGITL